MQIRILLLVIAFSLLTGCASLGTSTAPTQNWQQRSAQLAALQSWTVNGAISIQEEEKAQSASLTWQQQRDHYHVSLFGPLGFGRVEIDGMPGNITLTASNKPAMTAASPEELMEQQLGWQLPMTHLQLWARGLPVPGVPAKTTFDRQGRLVRLEQEGWEIDYLSYTQVGELELPYKMQLTLDNLKVKLVLRQWAI